MRIWFVIFLIIGSTVLLRVAGHQRRELPSPKRELYALGHSLMVAGALLWVLYLMSPTLFYYLPEPAANADVNELRNAIGEQRTAVKEMFKDLEDYLHVSSLVLLAAIVTVFHPLFAFAKAIAGEPVDEPASPTITLGLNKND